MKPYKLGSIWIDLDHVQGVEEYPKTLKMSGEWTPGWWYGYLYMAFQDKPLEVSLGFQPVDRTVPYYCPANIEATWTAFLKAWKERDSQVIAAQP